MAKNKFDFSGYATRVDLTCSDGRVIRKDAFKHNDGQTVPLVWQHIHNDPGNVLGHAVLENREDGVYAYCTFNNTEAGKNAKELVEHGDIKSLSIYANQLQQKVRDVVHGDIKEVSLVLAGANPGAYIDNLSIQHGDSVETIESEAIIYNDNEISLNDVQHSDDATKTFAALYHSLTEDQQKEFNKLILKHEDTPPAAPPEEKTIKDVFDSMTEEQQNVCYALIAQAMDGVEHSDLNDDEEEQKLEHSIEGGNNNMKKNLFDKGTDTGKTLSHDAITAVFADVKRYGTLKESALAHGIDNIDFLFPDAVNLDKTPQFISREMGWVQKVIGGVHHSPFSRIKSQFADITEDDARAKGYIKGNLKKEEVFSLLKRTTGPTTIYKKQKLDRDDVVDITDFDVVAWLKAEMRVMLDEEIARAILVGDGRLNSSEDKIKEDCIRPIWKDDALYTIKKSFTIAENATADQNAKAFIKSAIKARKEYKGSGNPVMYMTEDMLTDCLLIEDTTGRIIYTSVESLATTLRVREIITVPVMENLTRVDGTDTMTLHGIIVNLDDYNVGADKGGAVNMFDDFDIDYNAQKYLIETRASGALTKPYSSIVIESKPAIAG
jgi:HK97 family phage prohead protease